MKTDKPKKCLNDEFVDAWINKYLDELPSGWNTKLDMYLSMKNSFLEALDKPDLYIITIEKL